MWGKRSNRAEKMRFSASRSQSGKLWFVVTGFSRSGREASPFERGAGKPAEAGHYERLAQSRPWSLLSLSVSLRLAFLLRAAFGLWGRGFGRAGFRGVEFEYEFLGGDRAIALFQPFFEQIQRRVVAGIEGTRHPAAFAQSIARWFGIALK